MLTPFVFLIVCVILLFACFAGFLILKGLWRLIPFGIFILLAGVMIWLFPRFVITPFEAYLITLQQPCESCTVESIPTLPPVPDPKVTEEPPAPSCTEAKVIESQTHGGKVEVDLNDGDPWSYSLTIVTPNTPSNTKTLVVLTEPGYIFDVVHPVMYFTSYRLQGNLDQVLCSTSILVEKKALAYVFVGEAKTPEGWTTAGIKGWWTELVQKQYSDEKTVTPGGEWNTYQIAGSDKNRDLVSKNLIYGQFWNFHYDELVVHVQVQKGYTLKVLEDWQGTYWTVTGADPKLVQARFVQASKEVLKRDKLALGNMTLLYCGDPANKPTTRLVVGSKSIGWTMGLKYWTCEKTP